MRQIFSLVLASLCVAVALPCVTGSHAAPPADPVAVERLLVLAPWDPWSLLDRPLANRRLPEQLAAPSQRFRLSAGHETLVAAADALVQGQVPRKGVGPSVWHGFATVDLFLAARPAEVLDVSLNLLAYNVTASGGYRNRAGVSPGLAIHLHDRLGTLAGAPLDGDLIALDLGPVTVGHGLFVELSGMEGGVTRLQWGPAYLRFLLGGQVNWALDDLFLTTVDVYGVNLNWLVWAQDGLRGAPQLLSLAVETPGMPSWLRLAAEGGVRLTGDESPPRFAGLARTDWIPGPLGPVTLHLGYQFRIYEQGYSPRGDARVETPRMGFGTPAREDTYVTNAFDYLQASVLYHQWSHTVMAEGQYDLNEWLALRGEVEHRWWYFRDRVRPPRLSARDDDLGGYAWPLLPAPIEELYYRAGLQVRVVPGQPHRLRGWVANKFIASRGWLSDGTALRFAEPAWRITLELEAFL